MIESESESTNIRLWTARSEACTVLSVVTNGGTCDIH